MDDAFSIVWPVDPEWGHVAAYFVVGAIATWIGQGVAKMGNDLGVQLGCLVSIVGIICLVGIILTTARLLF